MDKREVEQIFALLQTFYPRAAALQSKELRYAWRLALAPYAYEDVREAVLCYAAKGKFFSDLSDLTADLPRRRETGAAKRGPQDWMVVYMANENETLGRVSRYARTHGLSWEQAKEQLMRMDTDNVG